MQRWRLQVSEVRSAECKWLYTLTQDADLLPEENQTRNSEAEQEALDYSAAKSKAALAAPASHAVGTAR